MKKLKTINWLWLLLPALASAAINPDELLDVDDAFIPSIRAVDADAVVLHFEIAEGYYLYKHAFRFTPQNFSLDDAAITWPVGKKKTDEFFGETEVYRHGIDIRLPYTDTSGASGALQFRYQGCADAGICYPPQRRTLNVDWPQPASGAGLPLGASGGALDGLFGNAPLVQDETVLPESQAFLFETIALDHDTLFGRFTLAPNIYLYKDKVKLTSATPGIEITGWHFPDAVIKDDPHFGRTEVFYDLVEFEIDVLRSRTEVNAIEIDAEFQGCVDEGICYPPSQRRLNVDLPPWPAGLAAPQSDESATVNDAGGASETAPAALSEQARIEADLDSKSWWRTVLSFLGFGLLLSLTPCVFPMIPILSGLIVGQKNISTWQAFGLSLVYVLAMALTYTAVGVAAGLLKATNIQAAFQQPWIIVSFSAVFVLLSLSMFGFYDLQLPARWQNRLTQISNRQSGGSYLGVAIMGFLSALIVGPCVAPPLAGAVLYITSNNENAFTGGLALFSMGMGMGVPLLLVGTSAGRWMPQSGGWMNVVKSFFGIALLGMAVWFLSRILDPTLVLFLWGALALASGVMWHQNTLDNGLTGGWVAALFRFIKLLLLIVGGAQIIGALAGGTQPLAPLKGLFGGAHQAAHIEFQTIKSIEDVRRALAASERPVMLDFYADWCIECKRMEATTFQDPQVVQTLSGWTALKADVTAQDDLDTALMDEFGIVGPPATLFFKPGGAPLAHLNFFGYKDAESMQALLLQAAQ